VAAVGQAAVDPEGPAVAVVAAAAVGAAAVLGAIAAAAISDPR
jgi:hypothetical protein